MGAMTYYSLKNIAILSAKGATFRCLLMDISKNEALKKLNKIKKMHYTCIACITIDSDLKIDKKIIRKFI